MLRLEIDDFSVIDSSRMGQSLHFVISFATKVRIAHACGTAQELPRDLLTGNRLFFSLFRVIGPEKSWIR